jgi:hypothetical protein
MMKKTSKNERQKLSIYEIRVSPNALLLELQNKLARKKYFTSAADCNCFLISSTSKIR